MYINATWNGRVYVGVTFLCLLCAFLPNHFGVNWPSKHLSKTKMGYISLPSHLNAIIGITSYYCVILKMVILHDAIKTIQNGVFVFFKKTKTCFFSKNGLDKRVFFKKTPVLSTLIVFQSFLWFSLDHTIWNKSPHFQFDCVCAAHLECRSLLMTKLRITGIWICKN